MLTNRPVKNPIQLTRDDVYRLTERWREGGRLLATETRNCQRSIKDRGVLRREAPSNHPSTQTTRKRPGRRKYSSIMWSIGWLSMPVSHCEAAASGTDKLPSHKPWPQTCRYVVARLLTGTVCWLFHARAISHLLLYTPLLLILWTGRHSDTSLAPHPTDASASKRKISNSGKYLSGFFSWIVDSFPGTTERPVFVGFPGCCW